MPRAIGKSLERLTTPREGWVASATADNAVATATRAAVAGARHRITGVAGSYSAAVAGGRLEILDGAAVIWTGFVHNQQVVTFDEPIAATAGNAVSARLAASGSLTVFGAVSLSGFTE